MRRIKNKTILAMAILVLVVIGFSLIIDEKQTVFADGGNVDRNMLSVKCQILSTTTPESASTNLRMVTTLDSIDYKYVGFEVYLYSNDGTTNNDVSSGNMDKVYENIVASEQSGVAYTFSPQIFGVDSKYFATYTLTNIKRGLFDNGILIKPYVIATGDNTNTRIYGTSKYLKIEDVLYLKDDDTSNDYFRIPTIVENGTYTITDSSSVEHTVSEMSFNDGTYRHLKIAGNPNKLQSVTTFTISNGDNTEVVSYRNLYRKLDANNDGTVDTDDSWYDSSKDSHVIVTATDLYSFASRINAGTADATDTYYLAADITVNDTVDTEGNKIDVSEWAESAPTYKWTPIGNSATSGYFNGIFDGQNHTISGICQNDSASITGLFGYTGTSTKIQKLRLIDSCFNNTKTSSTTTNYVGSIVGYGYGKFDTIYSNAYIYSKSENNGGLVGRIHNESGKSGEFYFNNCQFAGELNLTGNGKFGGGIVGKVMKKTTITNCLNTGTIQADNDNDPNIGGLCGYVHSNIQVDVIDSINVGKISSPATQREGLIVGYVVSGGVLQATNTYGTSESSDSSDSRTDELYGLSSPGTKKGATYMNMNDLSNAAGYWNTELDFVNYWQPVNGTLELKSFPTGAGEPKISYDTEWEGSGTSEKPYLISTTAELYGLAQQVNKDNTPQTYDGKYFKLTSDITINKEADQGKASTWGEEGNKPMFDWVPIGKNTSTADDNIQQGFKGNFNGNGHSISGVYVKNNDIRRGVGLFGATDGTSTSEGIKIQNFLLLNSYFESTSSEHAHLGSVVGLGKRTTLQNVYSDAIVVSSGYHNGGIMGRAVHSFVNIYDCWFAGELTLVTDKGRYAGGILGTTSVNTTIQDCLNTGMITGNNKQREDIGGLCGYINNYTTTITRSINASTLDTNGGVGCGLVMGYIGTGANANLVMTNVYVTNEQGWGNKNVVDSIASGKTYSGTVTPCALAALHGNGASGLFDGEGASHWTLVNDALPKLTYFNELLPQE